MSTDDDIFLAKKLAHLQQSFERDGDVLAVWEAIEVVDRHNKSCSKRGEPSHPPSDWIWAYLAETAAKISRLSLGIELSDERPLLEIPFAEVGKLRKAPQSDGDDAVRYRDERAKHVAHALGFVGDGWNAFQRRDRITDDTLQLHIYDDPALQEDPTLRKEVQGSLIGLIEKQENVSAASFRNRLSKARKRRRLPQD